MRNLKITIFVIMFLMFAYSVSAVETIDNFESYDLGNLLSQDSWTYESIGSSSYNIQGNIVSEGIKAVKGSNSDGASQYIVKPIIITQGGIFSMKMRVGNGGDGTIRYRSAVEGHKLVCEIELWDENNNGVVNAYLYTFANWQTIETDLNVNEWYDVYIELNIATGECRAKIGNGNWTNFIEQSNPPPYTLETLGLLAYAGEIYFDNIAFTPPITHRFLEITNNDLANILTYPNNLVNDLGNAIALLLGLPIGFWLISNLIGIIKR